MILDAVAACIAEEGIEGATIRRIAERANVSTGMLTYYYANKREMLAAALDTAGTHLRERIDSVAGPEPGPQRFDAVFNLLFTSRDEETRPWAFWVEYWAAATREPEVGNQHPPFAGMQANMTKWIEAGMRDGFFPPETDPVKGAKMLHALMIGLGMTTCLTDLTTREAEDITQMAISLLRAGAGVEGRP